MSKYPLEHLFPPVARSAAEISRIDRTAITMLRVLALLLVIPALLWVFVLLPMLSAIGWWIKQLGGEHV